MGPSSKLTSLIASRARLAVGLMAVGLFFSGAASSPRATASWLQVTRVIDGDTVVLEDGRHVRLIGINAPEYEPWKNVAQPYGRESRVFLKKLIEGRKVRLESDVEPFDRYRRTLAYLWNEEGEMVNRLIVQAGMARARFYFPNGRHRSELEADEAEARSAKKGLWSNEMINYPHA